MLLLKSFGASAYCKKLCASFYLHVVPVVPSRLPCRWAELSSVLNNPSSPWFEEFHANCKAVALQGLAVSHSSRGTKLSVARAEHETIIHLPSAHTDHTRATRADVFRKRRFRTGHLAISFEINADFHRNPVLRAMKGVKAAAKG